MGKDTKKKPEKAAPEYRLPAEGGWANAWKVAAAAAVLGVIGCAVGYASDPHRFAFSYLFAFMAFLAIALGALFFVLGQHLTGASWGVSTRRSAEFLLAGLPVFAILFIPIALHLDDLYPWMEMYRGEGSHEEAAPGGGEGDGHGDGAEGAAEGEEHGEALFGASTARAQDHGGHGENGGGEDHGGGGGGHGGEAGGGHDAHHTPAHAAHEAVLRAKSGYLQPTFFYIRALIYFAAWIFLAWFFFSNSTKQDQTGSLEHTKRMQRWAPLCTYVFAFSLTFAAFDWMMSLEPSWFSTIYGVQYFSVAVVSSLSSIIVLTLALRRAGAIGDAINPEHYHDLGKLLFGFLVFWAYISFSQFMLIWYAGIPEEATYYHLRWWAGGGFKTVSVVLIFLHFIVPFFLLISRNTKRRINILGFSAMWLLVMHLVEVYWLVMPYAHQSPATAEMTSAVQQIGQMQTELSPHWMDLASLLVVGGAYLAVVFSVMGRYALIPRRDPRVKRSLSFVNT